VSSVRKAAFGWPIWHSAAEKKDQKAPLWGQLKGNFALKPGFDLGVFRKRSLSTGILHDNSVSRSAGGHRGIAFGPDGGRLGGAQRTGNSGRVDAVWTFSLGLVGAGAALWPAAGAAPNARWRAWWRSGRCGSEPISQSAPQGLPTTGIPPLEAQMPRSRGDRDYQFRTSQFFPLPPQA
jgi:hypothetical protein